MFLQHADLHQPNPEHHSTNSPYFFQSLGL